MFCVSRMAFFCLFLSLFFAIFRHDPLMLRFCVVLCWLFVADAYKIPCLTIMFSRDTVQ